MKINENPRIKATRKMTGFQKIKTQKSKQINNKYQLDQQVDHQITHEHKKTDKIFILIHTYLREHEKKFIC